ncbi:type II toxin-antitoxin system RelE/ParE family toxin [Kosakonia sp. H02]|nr:type II toxin-antitoxin system RelE/ParE family toxin [Kosakonia sp. H02]
MLSFKRIFKTKWFAKAAQKHGIRDSELRRAIDEMMQGQADNLGGGVYKKRLNQNRDRAIVLAKGGSHGFYTFLYAKQDMANIDDSELAAFRELAKHYAYLSEKAILMLISNKELVEITHDNKK